MHFVLGKIMCTLKRLQKSVEGISVELLEIYVRDVFFMFYNCLTIRFVFVVEISGNI